MKAFHSRTFFKFFLKILVLFVIAHRQSKKRIRVPTPVLVWLSYVSGKLNISFGEEQTNTFWGITFNASGYALH